MNTLRQHPLHGPCLAMISLAGAFCLPAAHAASFDCAKAQQPAEKIICGDAQLNAADTRLGEIYRSDLAKLTSHDVGKLRVDQVQWLAWMQQVCHVGEPLRPAEAAACMRPLYDDRVKALRGAILRRDGVGFLVRTQYLATPETTSAGRPEFPGYGTLQASWPEADSTDGAWTAWSDAMRSATLEMATQVAAQNLSKNTTASSGNPPPMGSNAPWKDDLAKGSDSTIVARLKSVEHGRVTTHIAVDGMAHGGAHGFNSFQVVTWLLQEQRPLRVTDVFARGQLWRQTVARACWQQLHTGGQAQYLYAEVKGPDAAPLLQVTDDPTNWTLEADGLHISYPPYSVAPRVADPADAVLPWDSLKAVLADGFVRP